MRYLAAFLLLLCCQQGLADPIVRFRVSYPFSVLNFLQAAADDPHISTTYRNYIRAAVQPADSAAFGQMVRQYRLLAMEYNYVFNQYPEKRQRPHTTMDLVKIAAIKSKDLGEFTDRVSGMMPNEHWQGLRQVLPEAARFYDQLVYERYREPLDKQVQQLKQYSSRMDVVFAKLNDFYGSTWLPEQQFTVAVYGIPGEKGNTTASPHANALTLGVLTGTAPGPGTLGVVAHEIAHVLYDEQKLSVQETLEKAFAESNSSYKEYAHSYFDEALATATGNGWAYEYLTGTRDAGSWYNDDYINRFGKAIYPMVKEYIGSGRTIDAAFVQKAIQLFEKEFPDAIYSYQNLLNSVSFYTDAEDHSQYERISGSLERNFRVTSINSSYPILHKISQDRMQRSEETQFIIVHTGHADNFKALRDQFPELKAADETKEQLITFRDSRNRPVIVITVKDESRIPAALKLMADRKKYDPEKMIVPIH